MKSLLPVFVLLLAVLGCDLSKFTKGGDSNASPTPRSSPAPTATPKTSTTASPAPPTSSKPAIFLTLKKSAGKYPYEMKLLENSELQARLKKLMGGDFNAMKSHWNVETPIEVDKDLVYASACEAHNCGSNTYYMYIDVAGDNINVYHVEDGKTKTFFESGKISLPPAFASKMEE